MENLTPFQEALKKIKALEKEKESLKKELASIKSKSIEYEPSNVSSGSRLEIMIEESKRAMERNINRINKEARRYAKQKQS